MPISKSSRHSKVIGEFGEALLCNWLSRSGFEVAIIDHVGLDVIAFDPMRGERLGISVKARTRSIGTERTDVTVFRNNKENNDREKLESACEAFGCKPWIAVYVETDKAGSLYLTSLRHYDEVYRSKDAVSQDVWKMGVRWTKAYAADAEVLTLSTSFGADRWTFCEARKSL